LIDVFAGSTPNRVCLRGAPKPLVSVIIRLLPIPMGYWKGAGFADEYAEL